MKRILLTITIIAVAVSVSACTFWNDNGGSFLDNEMDESVNFNEDLSNYKTLELNIDLSVSEVKIEATNGDTLKYSQKANKVELLASLSKEENGNKIVLTFKNEKTPKIISGSQTSETVILVPEGIDVVIHSNGDVGDLNIDLDSLTVLEIDASTNVGDIVLNSNQDQSKLSYIETKSDVGDLHTTLNGKMNLLEQIVAGTATGQIDININGSFERAIDVKAKSDVGDIRLDFDGDYDEAVTVIVASSVGDLDLSVPRKHEIVLDAHTTEFTSKLEIDDMPFAKSKSIYNIEGEKSTFNIDLTVTVGEAAVKYSN